ncbi:MAG: hypothetical protein AAB496_01395 [Patescibacteria group bacterium]
MRKNISVIFGGSFGLYYGIFTEIEKKFNCKIMRTSPFRLTTKINGIGIKFYFCNSPIKDKNYYSQKKYLQSSQWKELMPPPANEVAKKIKNSNIVLLFGYCGVFKGKKSTYTPEIFKEVFFDTNRIMDIKESQIKVENAIKINNFLKPVKIGENAKVITSNLVLAPYHEKPESKDKVIRIASILSDFGDVVEKESYQIVKHLKKDSRIGVYLQASDVLSNKRHMLHPRGMEINREKFNRNVIKSLGFSLGK